MHRGEREAMISKIRLRASGLSISCGIDSLRRHRPDRMRRIGISTQDVTWSASVVRATSDLLRFSPWRS